MPSYDALPAAETVVSCRIRHQHALLFAQHVVHDGAAERDLLVAVDAGPVAYRLRLELAGFRVAEHDASAVRLNGLERQLHDPFQQRVDVEDVADRLCGFVHDAQVGEPGLEPRRTGLA